MPVRCGRLRIERHRPTRRATRSIAAAATAAIALAFPWLFAAVPAAVAGPPEVPTRLTSRLAARSDLIDVATLAPRIQVALAYSSAGNFLGRDVYGDLERCYLNADAARMLAAADRALQDRRPDLRLLVYDCVRPLSVQRAMWKLVAGTPRQAYVGNPRRRSLHNLGCAVDLTLATADGSPLDMGSSFDQFDERSQPRLERQLLRRGELARRQIANRRLLRAVMKGAGFRGISNEWWHFACAAPKRARSRYRAVE